MRQQTGWKRAASAILLFTAGAVLVKAADSPKAPARPGPGEAEYRLGPEDVIEVFVWKEPELTTTVTVRPDGRISLPLASELEASGKTAAELQQEITAKLSKYVVLPVVNVMVKQVNSLKISVLGEVRRPDVYRIQESGDRAGRHRDGWGLHGPRPAEQSNCTEKYSGRPATNQDQHQTASRRRERRASLPSDTGRQCLPFGTTVKRGVRG